MVVEADRVGDAVVMTAIPDRITLRMQAIPVPRSVVVMLLVYLALSLPLVALSVAYSFEAHRAADRLRDDMELSRVYTLTLVKLMARAGIEAPPAPWEEGEEGDAGSTSGKEGAVR